MSEDSDDRTEEATPERRRKAREEDGQFPKAKDTGPVAATGAILVALFGFGDAFLGTARNFAERCFRDTSVLRGVGLLSLGQEALHTLIILTLPIAGIAAVVGMAFGFAEAGFSPNIELVAPKWERIDPFSKLGSLFSPTSAGISTVMSLLRVGVVGGVTWHFTKEHFNMLVRLSNVRLTSAIAELGDTVLHLALSATLALAVLAAADYFQSYIQHERRIRMSRQEIKEEHHAQEGDPRVRMRQRQKARELLRRGLAKAIKTADVVLANPTHVSVALRYRPGEGAPMVVAKGFDEVAQYIKKLAAENGVPVVENKPLARALADRVRVGRVIPADLYVAVAEVLAFVYRMKNRGRRA
ncbi:MAG TPA: EscU/YscU/HrcU family type III secretion system export apparatus switch protein [Polyangiaceae bacterium]|jgi:flagellar biosynthetic protein FlhB|nr:EscU/YscU/HrcU family type III secretion system export apparatus switch protein [Polyangiaceae bacterium]